MFHLKRMSRLMRENARIISSLARYSPHRRKEVLRHAPKELVYALSEGCINVLKGNVPLSKQKYQKLRRYKKKIRTLANSRIGLRTKQNFVRQNGGFIGLLASALVPVLSTVVGNLLQPQRQ